MPDFECSIAGLHTTETPEEAAGEFAAQFRAPDSGPWVIEVRNCRDNTTTLVDEPDLGGPERCENCGGPEGYPTGNGGHAVGCPYGPAGPYPMLLEG